MGRKLDLKNKRFGRLIAIEDVDKAKDGSRIWLCKCNCGNYHKVRSRHLYQNKIKSCGCLNHEGWIKNHKNEKEIRKLKNIHCRMVGRCTNNNDDNWELYGGRGIMVCEEWKSFENFSNWILQNLGPRPSNQHSLDRINNNGNYEPGNVKWSTQKEQNENKRKVIKNYDYDQLKIKYVKLLQENFKLKEKLKEYESTRTT